MDWIACAERLPGFTDIGASTKTSDAVLAYCPAHVDRGLDVSESIQILSLESNRYSDGWSEIGWSNGDGGLMDLRYVSHWMLLPKGP